MPKKRLRIFAGPNGSGKSTIFEAVDKKYGCPYFINADEVQKKLSTDGRISFNHYTIIVHEDHLRESYIHSGFFERTTDKVKRDALVQTLKVKDNTLIIDPQLSDTYFSAFVADFLRVNMLNIVQEFSMETVMSDSRKVEYIKLAKTFGYRIYLYFVSTKDVDINIKRVDSRVRQGGHPVPEEKIRSRYERSLENAYDVLKLCDRAYFFDNSDENWVQVAEYDSGNLELSSTTVPRWFWDSIVKKIPGFKNK